MTGRGFDMNARDEEDAMWFLEFWGSASFADRGQYEAFWDRLPDDAQNRTWRALKIAAGVPTDASMSGAELYRRLHEVAWSNQSTAKEWQ